MVEEDNKSASLSSSSHSSLDLTSIGNSEGENDARQFREDDRGGEVRNVVQLANQEIVVGQNAVGDDYYANLAKGV